ncbi:MAG: CopG family transcriptional regulator [Xenococcaceae cyanobacterium]
MHIKIKPSQYDKLRRYAQSKDMSMADVLRRYIDRLPNV